MARIAASAVFVTGGQRGIGRAIALELLDRGVAKVYVTAREPRAEDDPRLVPVALDVTDPAAVEAAAKLANDADIVVNNAGISIPGTILGTDTAIIRETFETNFFGALNVARSFAPILAANGGGTLVNMLSVLSWLGGSGPYGASKAALWNATTSMRKDLRGQGTTVVGVHVALVETDMTKHIDVPKVAPAEVARAVADGIEAGTAEVIVDEATRQVKAALSGAPENLEY